MKNKNIVRGSIVEVFNRKLSPGLATCRIIGENLNGHVMRVAGVLEHRDAYLLVRATENGPRGGYEVHEDCVRPAELPA